MLKNTLVLKKGKPESLYFYCVLSGVLLGLCTEDIVFPIILLNVCLAYRKDIFSYALFVAPLLIASGATNEQFLFLYAGYAILFFLLMKGQELLKMDVQKTMTLWNVLFVCLGCYYLQQDLQNTLLMGVSTFLIHYFYLHMYVEEGKNRRSIILFTMSSGLYLLLLPYVPIYTVYLSLLYLIFIAYTMPFNVCFFVCLYFSFLDIQIYYLAFLLFINYNEDNRLFYSLLAWAFLIIDFSASAILFGFVCSMAGMFSYSENPYFMQDTYDIEKSHQLYMQHSFYKQLIHYSSIFHDLAAYYEDQPQQAQTLTLMGEALEYNAKLSKQYFHLKEEMHERIKQTLMGYHFDILSCFYDEKEDKIQISLELENLYQNELEEVVIPLIEKVSQTRLTLASSENVLFHKGRLRIILENEAYLTLDTYGESMKAHPSISGDSFHTFQLQQGLVCMLSDGMGQGEKAKKMSSLLIKMMETMLRCDIPQVECVKLINQFLRSDMYATLDVLSFDRKKNKAYLSKSASAPTFLLRNGELFEMSAHSLPIGIVDNIQANVFEMSFESGDIFIMTSDGMSREEIEKWAQLKRCTHVKNEGLNLMSMIKQKQRSDDSTILMVKVH